tara:strand:+ start:1015 stop:1206 length:192 start_codon:yes stop_codon:yes gene_type:complete
LDAPIPMWGLVYPKIVSKCLYQTCINTLNGTGQPYRVSSLVSFKEGVIVVMTVQFHSSPKFQI